MTALAHLALAAAAAAVLVLAARDPHGAGQAAGHLIARLGEAVNAAAASAGHVKGGHP